MIYRSFSCFLEPKSEKLQQPLKLMSISFTFYTFQSEFSLCNLTFSQTSSGSSRTCSLRYFLSWIYLNFYFPWSSDEIFVHLGPYFLNKSNISQISSEFQVSFFSSVSLRQWLIYLSRHCLPLQQSLLNLKLRSFAIWTQFFLFWPDAKFFS